MHIGVDASSWHNPRGYGRYMRSLFPALVALDGSNRYTFVTDSKRGTSEFPPSVQVKRVHASLPTTQAATANGRRSIGDMYRMSRALSDASFDLVIFPTIYSYVPVFTSARKLVVIHDVIPEDFPELTFSSRRARLYWEIKSTLGRRQADAIVTVSEFSRRAILRRYRLPKTRIYVTGEAGDPIFRVLDSPAPSPKLESLGLTGQDLLVAYVGGFGPHKNLERLLEAFCWIAQSPRLRSAKLVLVGEDRNEMFHSGVEALKAKIESLGIQKQVIFTGYVSDADLVLLLNLSAVLVLPSLAEGFGLPAIEAAACGCPVVATEQSPLPEIMGEAGLWIDPYDVNSMKFALSSVLGSQRLRRKMSRLGAGVAQSLTWERAAERMHKAIQGVGAA